MTRCEEAEGESVVDEKGGREELREGPEDDAEEEAEEEGGGGGRFQERWEMK